MTAAWGRVCARVGGALAAGVVAVAVGRATPAHGATRFSLGRDAEGAWLIAPDGGRFFSLGVCCVQPGPAPAAADPENPCYTALAHYAGAADWAAAASRRLDAWGFTTLGGWCALDVLPRPPAGPRMATPVLGMGAAAGAPWWDMWDEVNVRRMEDAARPQIEALRGDPRIAGYYSDNELGWWNAALWKTTLEQPPSSGQRRRLVALVREAYSDDWRRLESDFEPERADSFAALEQGGTLYLRAGGRGVRVMRQFLGLAADRYYAVSREILRRLDPGALYLGDRYPSFFYPEVVQAAARHVDAISSNLNPHWADGAFLRCYFETLKALSGKPVLVSEFYAAAAENGSGNRNDSGVYPVAATQSGRALAAKRTLEGLARRPEIAGVDWFQFADEPTHGRDDGENFNFGLVDIHDRPYPAVVGMFSKFDAHRLRSEAWVARRDVTGGAPRAPREPLAHFKPPAALLDWDRERGFVPPASPAPLADLYVCWSPDALWIGVYSLDIVESAYYRNAFVPKDDRALWTVRIGGREIVRARLGAGREPLVSEPRVRIENSSGMGNNVSNVAAMQIPAALLGLGRLRAGDRIELDSTLVTHAGAGRTAWKAEFSLK